MIYFISPFTPKSTLILYNKSNVPFSTQYLYNMKKNDTKSSAMRHGVRTKRLGRPADQRKAILRSLVTQVLTHGTIKTTVTRSKYVRKYVDKMITLSKNGSLHSRRQMEAYVYNKTLVKSIMSEAPERYSNRSGGYCSVNILPRTRRGDA